MKVEVYFNLHKRVFSVRSCKTGRVVHHTKNVHIRDPQFVVREGGRQRVLRERKKNVHAFVRGIMFHYHTVFFAPDTTTEVTYNPYKHSTFVIKGTEEAVDKAKIAVLSTNPDEGTTMRVIV